MPRSSLLLIPTPKSLKFSAGQFSLPPEMFVVLPPGPAALKSVNRFAAERFIGDAGLLTDTKFRMTTGEGFDPASAIRVRLEDSVGRKAPEAVRDQAYRLTITPAGVEVEARAASGIFYGFQTLLQIVRAVAFGKRETRSAKRETVRRLKAKHRESPACSLPCVAIEDFPDFARRGVYHDTARGKVPKIETLLQLIDDLAHLKFNEFQLYIENNFEFRKHPEMYDDTDPLTAKELQILDAACRERHIDFVPSLTSLGHFEKILSRPAFRPLAEAEPAQLKAIGATCWFDAAPWSLCVTDAAAKALLKDMYAELLPNFSSPHFNICCDEAYDLGAVRSKKAAEKLGGTGPLYLDWINYCNRLSHKHKKSIQLWGDIILNHPDLIAQLPKDATLLEWGYEWDHKFDEHCALFAERLGIEALRHKGTEAQRENGRSFYVSPGTSSWLTFASRTKNAFGNIHNAAVAGLKHGASGLLITDWGDHGHQQMLAVSLASIVYGAAAGWNLAATPNPMNRQKSPDVNAASLGELLHAISIQHFQDASGGVAALAYDLGLTYERFSWQRSNASLEHFLFREKWEISEFIDRVKPKDLRKVVAACEKLIAQFQNATLSHPHGQQIRNEFLFTCEEIIHTCKRTTLRKIWLAANLSGRNSPIPKSFKADMQAACSEIVELKKRFAALWLARNKRSRLTDVMAEFDRLAAEYKKYA